MGAGSLSMTMNEQECLIHTVFESLASTAGETIADDPQSEQPNRNRIRRAYKKVRDL